MDSLMDCSLYRIAVQGGCPAKKNQRRICKQGVLRRRAGERPGRSVQASMHPNFSVPHRKDAVGHCLLFEPAGYGL